MIVNEIVRHSYDWPRTTQALEQALAESAFPGAAIGLWDAKEPDLIETIALGKVSKKEGTKDVTSKTWYDLASLTKVLATAPLFASLVDRRWIDWYTPVQSLLPHYPFSETKMWHLLTHSAGYPATSTVSSYIESRIHGFKQSHDSIAARQAFAREFVLEHPLEYPIASRTLYSDLSFILLGFIIEEILNTSFDEAVTRNFWKKININNLLFFSEIKKFHKQESFAPACFDSSLRVQDDNCSSMGGYAGHAGVLGNVFGVLGVVQALWRGFLSREVLNSMWEPILFSNGKRTRGWDLVIEQGSSAGKYFSSGARGISVGHLGFTGTSLWIDLEAGIAITLLTNRTELGAEQEGIKKWRPLIYNAIREDHV